MDGHKCLVRKIKSGHDEQLAGQKKRGCVRRFGAWLSSLAGGAWFWCCGWRLCLTKSEQLDVFGRGEANEYKHAVQAQDPHAGVWIVYNQSRPNFKDFSEASMNAILANVGKRLLHVGVCERGIIPL
jgi:hypothetical protein